MKCAAFATTNKNQFAIPWQLTNHLGNILTVLSDKKTGKPKTGDPSMIGIYEFDMLTAADYTPFGMIMPGRNYSFLARYRYGFNGKEYDNDVQGPGNLLDYGNRMYDPLAGRFWGVDPLTKSYPWYTPYQFAGNRPINSIDLDGAEELEIHRMNLLRQKAQLQISVRTAPTIGPAPPPTWKQKWRDSENILFNMAYDAANGLYTLPQQLTASARQADYIHNIGGNVHKAHGIEGETQRTDNAVNAFSLFVPSAAAEQKGVGILSKLLSGFEKKALPSVERMFSPAIVDRGVAEEFATATKYKGFNNINSELGFQNAYYDLYNTATSTIVDVTTTNSKNMNLSGLYKKLDNLSSKVEEPFKNRILQVYVEEGRYTSDQLQGLRNKLQQYIKDYQLKSSFEITEVK